MYFSKSILCFDFREFADSIQKPFGVRYNPYTQSVDILSNTDKIVALVSELRGDLCIVSNALRKIHAEDEAVESINNMLHKGMNMAGVSPEKSPEK